MLKGLLNLLFPPRCSVCRNYGPDPICDDCLSKIKFLYSPYCRVCGKPRDRYFTGELCEDCAEETPAFTLASSVAVYEGVLKDAIHEFKFNGKRDLVKILGNMMANNISGSGIPIDKLDMVLPIPLSKKGVKQRGYNQSLLLAECIAAKFGLKIERNLLLKIKNIKPQHDLLRQERLSNIKGAFAADNVEGMDILLIDDIYTTGATVREASSALKHAGAGNIYVFTLARAVEH